MHMTDDYDRDEWHRINQMYAAAGLPVVMPEDWAPINALAELMDETITGPSGYFDAHPVTRAIAGETVRALVNSERTYDTRWCPDFDESRPRTMVRYYALIYGSTTLIPLDDLDQWEEVARRLFPEPRCDVHILHECYRLRDRKEFLDAETIAMKRGEIVCLFNICTLCREALTWIDFGSPEYSGPHPWTDDGSRSSDGDPWRI